MAVPWHGCDVVGASDQGRGADLGALPVAFFVGHQIFDLFPVALAEVGPFPVHHLGCESFRQRPPLHYKSELNEQSQSNSVWPTHHTRMLEHPI